MALTDYPSGQPIRSEADGTDQRVHIKVVDGVTSPAVNQMQVDSDHNAHIEMHGNKPSGVDVVMRLSEEGAPNQDGVYDATNNTVPATVAHIAHQRNATPGAAQQNQRITAIQSGNVIAQDISLHDESGNPYSLSNPLPVSVEETKGQEVHQPDQGAAIAAGANTVFTYTVPGGKTFDMHQIAVRATGKADFLIEVSDDGVTFSYYFALFTTASNMGDEICPKKPRTIATGGKVRITKTNKDEGAMDLHSLLIGVTY